MSNLIIKDITPLEDQENPFNIPSNHQIYSFRDKEQKKKKIRKEKEKKLPLYQRGKKQHYTIKKKYEKSKHSRYDIVSDKISKQIVGVKSLKKGKSTRGSKGNKAKRRTLRKLKSTGVLEKPNYQKEKMNNFVQKKRQMFLLQLAIDNKKKEMKRIKKKVKRRDKELLKEEEMLQKDIIKFKEFQTSNDVEAVKKMKLAEKETQKKIQKQNEIKNLQVKMSSLNQKIKKINERLQNCKKYKLFLDELTPSSWYEHQNEYEADHHNYHNYHNYQGAEQQENSEIIIPSVPSNKGKKDKKKDKEKGSKNKDKEKGLKMYFIYPDQLLEIFSKLEKKNLDQIKSSQEIEEQIELEKKKYEKIKEEKSKNIQELKKQIKEYKEEISYEDEKMKMLRSKKEKRSVTVEIEFELEDLLNEIKKIYFMIEESGKREKGKGKGKKGKGSKGGRRGSRDDEYGSSSRSQGGNDENQIPESELEHLYMLTNIETMLERYIQNIEDKNQDDKITKIVKEIEKERRQEIREKKNKMILEKKIRPRKSTTNKNNVQNKRNVKKIMQRSIPLEASGKKKKKKKEKVESIDQFSELFGI